MGGHRRLWKPTGNTGVARCIGVNADVARCISALANASRCDVLKIGKTYRPTIHMHIAVGMHQ
eukprot:8046872-Pyramimonas_sp.AAC.1